MVIPGGGFGGLLAETPTDEVLELHPKLRMAILSLAMVVIAEVMAAYIPTALTDVMTVLFGMLLLRRDVMGLVHGLPAFTVVAGFNFLFQAIALLQLLTGPPGAQHFLDQKCVVSVTRTVREGVNGAYAHVHEPMNLCSWRTVLGNVSVCCAVFLEFVCLRLSWKMLQSMSRAATASMSLAMLPMIDLEGLAPQDASSGHESRRARPNNRRQQDNNNPEQRPLTGQQSSTGFEPFTGQPHRLAE